MTVDAMAGSNGLQIDLLLFAHLIGAAALGLMIGYERSYHGRAAGMRTYGLVAMSSALLTVIAGYPQLWFAGFAHSAATPDPTRIIQGILTGIGFLGSGVIIKDGFTIRGLSTSASVWMTATIGIVVGLGFYVTAAIATAVIILMMSEFRAVESMLPHQILVRLELAFGREQAPTLAQLRERMTPFGFSVTDAAYHCDSETGRMEFTLTLRAVGNDNADRLAQALQRDGDLLEFRLNTSHS